jgi:hypothetical protein
MDASVERPSWLARHWAWIPRTLRGLGILLLVFAVVLNPWLVESLLSSDGQLSSTAWRTVFAADGVLILMGILSLMLARGMRNYTPRRRRFVVGFSVMGISLLLGGFALEGALRYVHAYVRPLPKSRHYFLRHDANLGWKHRPETTCTFKGCPVRINAQGLRGPDVARTPQPDVARILMLGDSQLFGDGAGEGQTFVDLIREQDPLLEPINAGVIGYGTDQQQIYYQQSGHALIPRRTILTLNAYDLRDNVSRVVRSGYQKPVYELEEDQLRLTNVPVPNLDPVSRADRRIRETSQLYDVVRSLWKGWRQGELDSQPEEQVPTSQDVFPPERQRLEALKITLRILDRLHADCQTHGSRLSVLLLPYAMDFGDDPRYRALSQWWVDAVVQWGQSADVEVWDLREPLAQADPEEIFLDTMHFSPEGHRRVAEHLLDLLDESDASLPSDATHQGQ